MVRRVSKTVNPHKLRKMKGKPTSDEASSNFQRVNEKTGEWRESHYVGPW